MVPNLVRYIWISMTQKILVTGGAGYIGSHAVKALCDHGYEVVVLDNLSKGHGQAIDERVSFVHMDLADKHELIEFMKEDSFDGVMHFAGSIEVGLSMERPDLFLQNNVMNGQNLLEAMRATGCNSIIFSSTAAVYGNPKTIPIPEDAHLEPTNYYGVTKLLFENLLQKYDEFYGFNYCALRYFNAAGADAAGNLGESHNPETHLIPRVLGAIVGTSELKIFGTDYDTKDGTCVRDYIHVIDLVAAHVLALEYLFKEKKSGVFNLGNGHGFTVKEVISAAEKVTGKKVPYEEGARREGDPAVLVADSSKAKRILGWNPAHAELEEIIASAWKWHSSHPRGYT